MANSQTTIPAAAGGFSAVSVPIPAGTCAARLQPTLSDSDWTAGQQLTCAVDWYVGGTLAGSLDGWILGTGSLQPDAQFPAPCICEVAAPAQWPFDSAVFTVRCADGSIEVGAVVSFADNPANLPAPILPPGYNGRQQ